MCVVVAQARSSFLWVADQSKLMSSKSKTAVVWRWYTLIWINTRVFAIRFHLHARVSVKRWTFDAAIFLYDTQTGTGRG
jgi:hypothetical protein